MFIVSVLIDSCKILLLLSKYLFQNYHHLQQQQYHPSSYLDLPNPNNYPRDLFSYQTNQQVSNSSSYQNQSFQQNPDPFNQSTNQHHHHRPPPLSNQSSLFGDLASKSYLEDYQPNRFYDNVRQQTQSQLTKSFSNPNIQSFFENSNNQRTVRINTRCFELSLESKKKTFSRKKVSR